MITNVYGEARAARPEAAESGLPLEGKPQTEDRMLEPEVAAKVNERAAQMFPYDFGRTLRNCLHYKSLVNWAKEQLAKLNQ